MSKSQVSILNLKALYNILFEIRENFNFEILNFENEIDLIKSNKANNSLVIVTNKFLNDSIDPKNIIILDDMPIKIISLIDKINTFLLKQKYSLQSNFNIKKYKLDLNSRMISNNEKNLKLTEREIEIILFLNNQDKPQKIETLQKEVWGYSANLETHTVETHIYRLRKKINEKFNDENFLVSLKDGYKI
ncbi:MAG: winged helix-turn-helix domain-containing protein [Candidatus Pelagibacter sp.]